MNALILQNDVVQVSETAFEVAPALIWVKCPNDCQAGWKYIDGQFIAPIIPQPTPEEQLYQFNEIVQNYIDEVAKLRGYINGAVCVSYWFSTVLIWSDDAKTFAPWRDNVWQLTFAAIEPFESGTGSLPDVNTFIDSLPKIVWP